MQIRQITIIGGGNMASALVGGLRANHFDPAHITVTDRVETQLARLRKDFGVKTQTDNAVAARDADLVILAVKPQDLRDVAAQIAPAVKARGPLVLSVAAGTRIEAISRALDGYEHIVRAMPNRPALLGKGVTALFAPPAVDAQARAAVEAVVRSVGGVVWLKNEQQMDAVTAVSGSGPAYFFLLIELLEQAALEEGLPADVAHTLAVETAYGAGCMAREPGSDAAVLRKEVTSPGGTTAAALAVLENAGLRDIVRRAVAAAARRSAELAGDKPQ